MVLCESVSNYIDVLVQDLPGDVELAGGNQGTVTEEAILDNEAPVELKALI